MHAAKPLPPSRRLAQTVEIRLSAFLRKRQLLNAAAPINTVAFYTRCKEVHRSHACRHVSEAITAQPEPDFRSVIRRQRSWTVWILRGGRCSFLCSHLRTRLRNWLGLRRFCLADSRPPFPCSLDNRSTTSSTQLPLRPFHLGLGFLNSSPPLALRSRNPSPCRRAQHSLCWSCPICRGSWTARASVPELSLNLSYGCFESGFLRFVPN